MNQWTTCLFKLGSKKIPLILFLKTCEIKRFNQTLKCATLNPLNYLNLLFDFTKAIAKSIQN